MDTNFSNLKGKKMLFLGAESLMCQLIETAKKMGLYTIATDYNTDFRLSPGKLVADEYWNIDWTDYDELEKACRESQVNGVFSAFSEFKIVAASTLCDRLGLPFYGDKEQLDIIRDKSKFKEVCKEYGIPTVEEYKLSADLSENQLSALRYPIVVKPTDSAGSQGISVIYDKTCLRFAMDKALSFSSSKSIIAERYMECPEVNVIYTIQDGKVSLSCMSETIHGAQKRGQIRLTDGLLSPCRYLLDFMNSIDSDIRNMLRGIGIRNGSIFLMVFYDQGTFRIFEANYRISGGATYNLIAYNNEIDFMKMMLSYSITGKMEGWDVIKSDSPFFKHPCCSLAIVAKPGEVGHVCDRKMISEMPGILSYAQCYQEGQVIPDSSDLHQTFARVNIAADSPVDLADKIQAVYQILDLKDVDGNDMILSRMDRSHVAHYWDNTGLYN